MTRFETTWTALKSGRKTRHLALSIAVTVLVALIVWNATAGRRRVWAPAETPVAFWSWRSETPSTSDVNEAIRQTSARVLFLRAGQIDYESGKLSRIRRVTGAIPSNIRFTLCTTPRDPSSNSLKRSRMLTLPAPSCLPSTPMLIGQK